MTSNEEKHELLVGLSGRKYFAPVIPIGPIYNMEGFIPSPVATRYDNLSDEELIRHVDNLPAATELERLLVQRLVSVKQEIGVRLRILEEADAKGKQLELDFSKDVNA